MSGAPAVASRPTDPLLGGGPSSFRGMANPATTGGMTDEDLIGIDMEEQDRATLGEDLRELAEEAKALALAELAFQKSRATYAASEARSMAILAVAALVFVFFALMALVVGLVIALGPLLTAWGAMAVVTLALVGLAGACALSIKARIGRMSRILGDDGVDAMEDLA